MCKKLIARCVITLALAVLLMGAKCPGIPETHEIEVTIVTEDMIEMAFQARGSINYEASAEIIERFSEFNSLQTLVELVNPFADTSQALLLHLLQILAWALAGYVAGVLARRIWSDRWRGWSPLLSAIAATGVLWLGYGLLPGLVNQQALDLNAWPDDVLPWLLASALLAATLRQFYVYLRRPIVARPSRRPAAAQIRAVPHKEQAPKTPEAQPSFNWTPAKRKPETDDDIIMLEID